MPSPFDAVVGLPPLPRIERDYNVYAAGGDGDEIWTESATAALAHFDKLTRDGDYPRCVSYPTAIAQDGHAITLTATFTRHTRDELAAIAATTTTNEG